MFFFKVEISSFDDAAKTLFVVPEQHSDEQGVPFEDKMLTQTADFKQFVKSTQTCMVDGKYTQYKTDGVFESITEQQFEQLKAEGKVEELDSNSFSISTGFSPKKGGGKKDFKTLLIIGGAAIVLIALLIFSSMSGGGKGDVSETTESTEPVETTSTEETESTDAPETSESTPAESESKPSETTTSSTENSEYVDEPTDTTSEPTDEANEDGYTDSGYSGGSSSSNGGSGIYTISFNLNGGTGTLDSISENAGQYVVLPSAEEAAKTVSKKGYKLIGFSDNTEIAYPLYHYKMPYENVTLFAVWSLTHSMSPIIPTAARDSSPKRRLSTAQMFRCQRIFRCIRTVCFLRAGRKQRVLNRHLIRLQCPPKTLRFMPCGVRKSLRRK